MSLELQCWKCGQTLPELPMPLGRRECCPVCDADLHVCRLCEFHDTGVAHECREPVAEPVADKTRANFCGYFRPRPGAHSAPGHADADAARAQLSALFDLGTVTGQGDAEDAERRLRDLFGLDGQEKKN